MPLLETSYWPKTVSLFFLFSYQVHEKTILFCLLPINLLFTKYPVFSSWFSLVATFRFLAFFMHYSLILASLYPLLKKDGLMIPYFVMFFTQVIVFPFENCRSSLEKGFIFACLFMMGGLHMFYCYPAPMKYPDIHSFLISCYSCACFLLAFAYMYRQLIQTLTKQDWSIWKTCRCAYGSHEKWIFSLWNASKSLHSVRM